MANAISGSGRKAGKPADDACSAAYVLGWNDRKAGLGFREDYESASYEWQRNYEMGRAACSVHAKPRKLRMDHGLRRHFDREPAIQRQERRYHLR